jgi:Mannosyltransferase (PIG-V)
MSEPPPWRKRALAAADLVTFVCTLLAAILLLTGPYRDVIGGVIVSFPWTDAAFAAAALAAIRHAAVPRPSIVATVDACLAEIRRRPALNDAVLAFWATRPAVILIGFLAVLTIGLPEAAREQSPTSTPLRSLPARWDAQWYAGIAAYGYEWQYRFDRQQNLAFFPAYPLLIRAAGSCVGAFRSGLPVERQIVTLTWCGLFIALAAFFWAAWYFARLAREMLDESRARNALLLLASYPFALFFSAAYTESLFLLAALATWWHVRRGDTAVAFAWGLLAGLSRPNGCLLSVPLTLIAAGLRDFPVASAKTDAGAKSYEHSRNRLIVAAAPTIGMLVFTVYLHHVTGIWFAWSRMHSAWGRVFGRGLSDFAEAIGRASLLDTVVSHPYDALNALGLLFALALLVPVWRRVGQPWGVFVLINVLAPLSAGGVLSMGRLTSTLFPLFLAFAAVLPSRSVAPVVAASAALQGVFAALFYTWRGLY